MSEQISTLVPVTDTNIGSVVVNAVNARNLHSYLESKQHFSDWIKNRISQYGFTQDVDFVAIHNSMTSPPSLEYHITLDMAKELAMVERNEKGKEVRQYFIECERKLVQIATQPMSLAQQALINAQALVEMENRQKQLEENQEKLLKASQGMWTKIKTVDESVDQRILEKLDRFWDNTKNLSATDVGRQLRCSAQEVNRCAAYLGWIDPIFKNPSNPKKGIDGWELQEEGRLYASQRFDNNGHPVSPVFYGKEAIEQIRALRNSRPSSAWCLTQIIARYERRQQDNAA